MKILQLIPHLGGGGAERFTVDLSNYLSREYQIDLLTLYDPTDKEFFRKDIDQGVAVHSLGKKPRFDFRIFGRLYKQIQQIKPEVIHSHLRSINYLAAVYPFLKRMPVVYTVHSDALKDCPNQIIRTFRQQLFRLNSVASVTISEANQQSFQKAFKNIDSELISNGRAYPNKDNLYTEVIEEVEKLKLDSNTKVCVHIGRLTPEKNQLMLVDAFTQLVEKGQANAILIIIGRGRDSEVSRRIQLKLKEAHEEHEFIHVLGERSNATDYLHAADYFCLSSKYEGMPITLIEAFATGCIPICTQAGGIPEMIQDLEPALVPKSTDKDDYYKLLKYVMDLPEEKQVLIKEKAVELFKNKYSMERCADEYLSLYKNLIKRK